MSYVFEALAHTLYVPTNKSSFILGKRNHDQTNRTDFCIRCEIMRKNAKQLIMWKTFSSKEAFRQVRLFLVQKFFFRQSEFFELISVLFVDEISSKLFLFRKFVSHSKQILKFYNLFQFSEHTLKKEESFCKTSAFFASKTQ